LPCCFGFLPQRIDTESCLFVSLGNGFRLSPLCDPDVFQKRCLSQFSECIVFAASRIRIKSDTSSLFFILCQFCIPRRYIARQTLRMSI
jgi:hypothetical protein